jgi:uncharacterized protein (TIGR02145 family)
MKKKHFLSFYFVVFLFGLLNAQSPTTVTIGSQVWMTENLNVSQFNNGDIIPEAKTNEEWESYCFKEQACWCYYKNDPKNAKYGKLYNWYAVNDPRGLAPQGFHVPSKQELMDLSKFIGENGAKKIKSTSGWLQYKKEHFDECKNCKNWNDEYRKKVPCHVCKDRRSITLPSTMENGNGDNTFGFNAKAGGMRGNIWYPRTRNDESCKSPEFHDLGERGYWWTSTKPNGYGGEFKASFIEIGNHHSNELVYGFGDCDKSCGFSVRCIQGIGQSENVTQFEKPKVEIVPPTPTDWKKHSKTVPKTCTPDKSDSNFFKTFYKQGFEDEAAKRFVEYYKRKLGNPWDYSNVLDEQCDEEELMKMLYGNKSISDDGYKLHEMGGINFLVNKVVPIYGDVIRGEVFFNEDKLKFPDQVK